MTKIHTTLRNLTAAALALALFLGTAANAAAAQKTVNINTASAEQLSNLPRVGPAIAQRIMDFRKENGPFKVAEDLMLVRGIGEKTFALLKPYITLSGDTTLTEKVRTPRASSEEQSEQQD